jgi:hypothetical protein
MMRRRRFIRLSLIGGTAIGFGGMYCNARRSAFFSVLDKPMQLSYICDTHTIRDIGLSYRLQIPAEAGPDKLTELLSTDSVGSPIPASANKLFVQTLIDQKIKQDFEKGNTVLVKGWILSVTEARQCALFAVNNQ